MKKAWDWSVHTVLGQIVLAILFFPLGLIWWTFTTDLIWTTVGTLLCIGMVLFERNRRDNG